MFKGWCDFVQILMRSLWKCVMTSHTPKTDLKLHKKREHKVYVYQVLFLWCYFSEICKTADKVNIMSNAILIKKADSLKYYANVIYIF